MYSLVGKESDNNIRLLFNPLLSVYLEFTLPTFTRSHLNDIITRDSSKRFYVSGIPLFSKGGDK